MREPKIEADLLIKSEFGDGGEAVYFGVRREGAYVRLLIENVKGIAGARLSVSQARALASYLVSEIAEIERAA